MATTDKTIQADASPVAPNAGASFLMPTSTGPELIAWCEKKRETGNKRMPDLQMKMNLAYVLGHQWIVWDRDRRQFRRPQWRPNDPNAPVRITINKIGGIVERTISRLTKEAPDPECRPVSDDESDIGSARVASRILDHEMERTRWDTNLVELYFWVTICGWSFFHVYWDAASGDIVGEVTLEGGDPESNSTMTVYKGDVVCEIVPAFELACDPNARRFEDCRWAVRTVSLTLEACWEKFGRIPDGGQPGRTLVDEVYALTDKAREDRPIVTTVAVHQIWVRPGSRACPKGAVVTWAGKTVLDRKDFPYDHHKLPFIQFDLLPGLGGREGRTWLTDLIQIQADYNDARSREAATRRLMTPKILYPVGSIDPQRLTSRVEAVPYLPTGNPPNYMMPDSRYMAQHETVMDRGEKEMGDRAGQNEVSSGNAPASMPAASVMALQEADDTKMAISMKLMAKGISQTGWQWLMLVKQFWDEPRIVRTWSQEGDIEVGDFLGSDIGESLDVHVSSESSLPKSKAARLNLLMQLVQIPGMFDNPRDFLKQLDLPGVSPLLSTMSIDNKQAERENAKLAKGIQCEVHQWDNHQVHLKEHNDFRKSEEYEKLPPEIRAVVDAHVTVQQEAAIGAQTYPVMPGQTPLDQGVPPGAPGEAPPSPDGQPNDLSQEGIRQTAGIGGPGEQGAVPGIGADLQAAQTGM